MRKIEIPEVDTSFPLNLSISEPKGQSRLPLLLEISLEIKGINTIFQFVGRIKVGTSPHFQDPRREPPKGKVVTEIPRCDFTFESVCEQASKFLEPQNKSPMISAYQHYWL